MTRLHVETVAEGPRVLDGPAFHHLVRVLRAKVGDSVVLFDGRGREAEARVARLWPTELLLTVGPVRAAVRDPVPITLIVGLLKGEKMDWVVQKATELGVARLVPVRTVHGVVKLDAARGATRTERWLKIAREAAEQCGRADLPEIVEPAALEVALATAPGWKVLFHEVERTVALREVLPAEQPAAVSAAIGPEGGFAPGEVAAARAAGFMVCGLGPRVLRAETAALTALAVLGHVFH